jgi:hypothetical protein
MYHHHLELEDAALVLRALIVLPKQQHHWCSIAVLQLQQLLVCPAAEALNMGSNGLQDSQPQSTLPWFEASAYNNIKLLLLCLSSNIHKQKWCESTSKYNRQISRSWLKCKPQLPWNITIRQQPL